MTQGTNTELAPTDEGVRAMQSIPQDMALLKLENESIMALAASRPRDHRAIIADIREQLAAYPSFAREAIYNKPVGKDEHGQMQYARNLSIRAAEAVAEAYGYNRVRAEIVPVDDNMVRVEASFTDYQKGRIWQDAGLVSKWYKASGGKIARHSEDRFLNVIVKAEKSKYVREVILRSVPPGLRSELMEMAEAKIDELLDDATVEKIISNFANKGVTIERLEQHLGRTRKAGWMKQDRVNLIGIWTAIKDEETTIAEAFGEQQREQQPAKEPAGEASTSDLTNPNLVTDTTAAATPEEPAVTPNSEATEPEKRKPGRPKGSTNTPKTDPPAVPEENLDLSALRVRCKTLCGKVGYNSDALADILVAYNLRVEDSIVKGMEKLSATQLQALAMRLEQAANS